MCFIHVLNCRAADCGMNVLVQNHNLAEADWVIASSSGSPPPCVRNQRVGRLSM